MRLAVAVFAVFLGCHALASALTTARGFGRELVEEDRNSSIVIKPIGNGDDDFPFPALRDLDDLGETTRAPVPRPLFPEAMARDDETENTRRPVPRQSVLSCGGSVSMPQSASVEFRSPNFPSNYPSTSSCKWTFSIPSNVDVYLQCAEFSLPGVYPNTCNNDVLQAQAANGAYTYRLCGTVLANAAGLLQRVGSSYVLNVELLTNCDALTGRFRCSVTTVPLSGGTTTTTAAPAGNGCSVCGIANGAAAGRIVGGAPTLANQYPWQVGLVPNGGSVPFCGGTLIAPQYVLTAAHCCAAVSASQYQVALGAHSIVNRNQGQTFVNVASATINPGYNPNTVDNDYCVLRLATPVAYSSKIRPACLPTSANQCALGTPVTTTGWGNLQQGGNQPSVLYGVNMTIVPCSTNGNRYPTSQITNQMFCAGTSPTPSGGKDSCNGDSGGPLVAATGSGGRYVLCGVTSWGFGCSETAYPGVYSKVTAALAFIQQATGSSTCPA